MDKCYICGGPEHLPAGHTFWTEKDAAEEFSREPRVLGYSPESAYVDQHRPR